MHILETVIINLLYSLVDVSNNTIWKESVIAYYAYSPIAFVLIPILGFAITYRSSSHSTFFYFIQEKCTLLIVLFLVCIVAGLFLLYFSAMNTYYLIPFTACVLFLLLCIGFKIAIIIKKNHWVLLYLIVVVVMFVSAYIISGAPAIRGISTKSSKRELNQTFQGITGRNPDQDEKKAFWKGAIGEEKPSESKKDEYWRENK